MMMMMMFVFLFVKTLLLGCFKIGGFLRASTITDQRAVLRSAMIDDRATRASSGTSFSSLSLNRTGNYDTQTIVTIKETNAFGRRCACRKQVNGIVRVFLRDNRL